MAVGCAVRNEAHRWQYRPRDRAPRKLEPAIAAAARVRVAFQRRCCAAENHRHVAEPRAIDRDVARVISHAILLPERDVVLLVHDDEPQPRQRRVNGESRAHDELRITPRGSESRLILRRPAANGKFVENYVGLLEPVKADDVIYVREALF